MSKLMTIHSSTTSQNDAFLDYPKNILISKLKSSINFKTRLLAQNLSIVGDGYYFLDIENNDLFELDEKGVNRRNEHEVIVITSYNQIRNLISGSYYFYKLGGDCLVCHRFW